MKRKSERTQSLTHLQIRRVTTSSRIKMMNEEEFINNNPSFVSLKSSDRVERQMQIRRPHSSAAAYENCSPSKKLIVIRITSGRASSLGSGLKTRSSIVLAKENVVNLPSSYGDSQRASSIWKLVYSSSARKKYSTEKSKDQQKQKNYQTCQTNRYAQSIEPTTLSIREIDIDPVQLNLKEKDNRISLKRQEQEKRYQSTLQLIKSKCVKSHNQESGVAREIRKIISEYDTQKKQRWQRYQNRLGKLKKNP